MPRRSDATFRWGLVLLSILAFALRAYRLTAQSLWSDEDITLDRAGQPLAALLAGLPVEQAPGYYVLMRLWTQVAGDGDLALRFPSLVAGVLAVPLAGLVGARAGDRDTGLLLGLIVAIQPFLVYYGQEARMYALLFTLALAVLAAMHQALDTGRTAWWILCGALVAATLYTHYYGALIVFGLAGWALFDLWARDRDRLRGWAIAGLTATLLFGPWLPRALGVLQFEGWRSALPLSEAPMAHLTDWLVGRTLPDGHPTVWIPLIAIALALLLMGFLVLIEIVTNRPSRTATSRPPGRPYNARQGAALDLLPLLAYALILLRTADTTGGWSRATVDYDPRYAMAALPGLYSMVALGMTLLGWLVGLPAYLASRLLPERFRAVIDRRLRTSRGGGNQLLAALLLLAAAWPGLHDLYTNPASQKQDYRSFVAAVEAEASHEDTVLLLDGPNYGLARRYEIEDSPVKIVNLHSTGNLERGPEARAAYAAELSSIFPHIWLAEDGARLGNAKAWLDANTYPVSTAGFQDITLRRYYRPVLAELDPAAAFDSDRQVSMRFFTSVGDETDTFGPGDLGTAGQEASEGLGCSGITLETVPAGAMLPVAISCSTRTSLDAELKVSVRLGPRMDPASTDTVSVVAAVDRRPVNWTRPTSSWEPNEVILDRHALALPSDLRPGSYVLVVIYYDEQSLREEITLVAGIEVEPAR